MDQQIEITKLKEWIGELYLEKKMMEKVIQEQAALIEALKKEGQ